MNEKPPRTHGTLPQLLQVGIPKGFVSPPDFQAHSKNGDLVTCCIFHRKTARWFGMTRLLNEWCATGSRHSGAYPFVGY